MTKPTVDVRSHIVDNSRVDPETGCWIWQRPLNTPGGYGRFSTRGVMVLAHVAAYVNFIGPVPEGLELDHLCGRGICVNPWHLEPVTHQENVRRGAAGARQPVREVCKWGHPLTPENVMPRRARTARPSYRCRTCHNRYTAESKARAKAA